MVLKPNPSGRRVFVRRLLSGAVLGVAGATRLMAADKLDPAEP